MYHPLRTLLLRRSIHSQNVRSATPRSLNRFTLLLAGAAAAGTGYVAWRTASAPRVQFDAPPEKKSRQKPRETVNPVDTASEPQPTAASAIPIEDSDMQPGQQSPEDVQSAEESQGASGGAYDPVTGEINWDCPCLGGMAHGPCGPEFREAFSCFIYSEEEPKGINCVDKFKAMQDCFREHPEVYGEEIMEDDDEEGAGGDMGEQRPVVVEEQPFVPDEVPLAPADSPPAKPPLKLKKKPSKSKDGLPPPETTPTEQ